MERYERYKDSGIEWIGEIPEHWGMMKLKYLSNSNPSNIDKKSKDDEDDIFLCNYVDVYNNEFITSEIDFMKATANRSQIEKFILNKGDVIATKDSETPDDIANPALVIEDFDNVVCGYHLTHIKTKGINGEYLFRQFQSTFLQAYFEVSANGVTRYGLGVDKFNSVLIIVPPPEEQTAIANHLDRKTAEIDDLIAQKEQLLKLYEAEKSAIINQAVTKGINPDVKLKDSGIEWLGEIPEHWGLSKLKYLLEVKDGTHDTPAYILKANASYPLITSKDIQAGFIDFSDCKYISAEDYKNINKRSNVIKGDIIMPMIGTVGGAVVVKADKPFSIKNVALFKTSNSQSKPSYIQYLIDSLFVKEQFKLESRGGVQDFVSLSLLKNILVFDIAQEEQNQIVQYIETETALIDAKTKKTKKLIELQKEYRTALISEVVTGKIKV